MKVITAIGIPEINKRLKNENIYEVIGRDIQYQEGIIEVLEEREDIEGLIISNILPEEVEFKELIYKILEIASKIEIIVFLKEKNEEIEMFLNSQKIYKIYYLNDYEQFFMSFKKSNLSKEDISKSIEDFKKIILKNPLKEFNKEKNMNEKSILSRGKIISITGVFGTGKSIISIIIAKYLSKNRKVLLIDSDYFNCSINTILGTSNNKNSIYKYNENLSILFLEENYFYSYENINQLFVKIKEEFDFIIIDTSSNLEIDKNRFILSNSSKVITLIEPNLSEVKKSNIFLEKIIRDFEIDISKVNIIFNKINKYKISKRILKEIYSEINILGEIEYSEKYNLIINKNIFKDQNIYEDIFQKLLE